MLIMGIDSSSKAASVGIMDDEKMIVSYTLNDKKTHSEKLMEMIDKALKEAKCKIKDIDVFCACKGPGSFTGLRIGLSTVKGICHALNKPCYMCSTLSMLYENVKENYKEDCLIIPLMDARRNEVYTSIFCGGKKALDDCATSIYELVKKADEISKDKDVVFTGDGVLPNLEILKEHYGERAYFAPEEIRYGSGYAVIKAALNENNKVSYDEILPSYLRLSQAERLKNN